MNQKRILEKDIDKALTPAVFSYDGISFLHLAAKVLEEAHLQRHEGVCGNIGDFAAA